jgi:hypothetical protein
MSLRHQHPWMLANISARSLFWAGMLVLPAYLLQQDLVVRLVQVVLFGGLARLAGKRLQWLYFGSIIVTITIFHVIVPSGEVLAEVAGFRITAGALRTGVFKALTIVGMVFVSLVAVRADLRLPGRLGELAGKIFWAFEQIMERRDELSLRRPFESVDRFLDHLYGELVSMGSGIADTAERKETARRSTGLGMATVGSIVTAQWLLLVPSFL